MPVLNTVTARDSIDGSELTFTENEREEPHALTDLVVRVEMTASSVELQADELRELADQLDELHRKITRGTVLGNVRRDL